MRKCDEKTIQSIIESLTYRVDMHIVNDFGEHVWLKENFLEDGTRFGITDCCFYDNPCDWHKALNFYNINYYPTSTT